MDKEDVHGGAPQAIGASRARLALLLGVGAVSFSSILSRLSGADPLAIAFYRQLLAGVLLMPWAIPKLGELKALSRKEQSLLLVSGLFLAVHFGTWITSIFQTTIAASVVLVHTDPIMVAALAYVFLGERPGRRTLFGFLLAIVGVVAITGGDSYSAAFMVGSGDFLALTGAFAVAIYILAGRRLRRTLSVITYASVVYLLSAFFLLMWAPLSGQTLTGYTSLQYLMFLALALGPSVLGHTSFNYALKYVKASTVSVSTLGEPAVASLLAVIVFSEVPSGYAALGAALVLAGLYVALR
jgi:drug/metabolite transporter (DMT)-like permease